LLLLQILLIFLLLILLLIFLSTAALFLDVVWPFRGDAGAVEEGDGERESG